MEQTLQRIRERLKIGGYPNEQTVSQGIVLPVLRQLGWDDSDPSIVYPEFPLRSMHVDFALIPNEDQQPAIIIEAKRVGNLGSADEQLFNYAFHAGAGIAILTDGKEWHFYVPVTIGRYHDKRFYKIDLVESAIDQILYGFQRYLAFAEVSSGQAFKNAHKDFEKVKLKNKVDETLPEAWNKLVEEENPELLQVLSERVADIINYSPENVQVIRFLQGLQISDTPKPESESPSSPDPSDPPPPTSGDFRLDKNGAYGIGFPSGNLFVVRKGAYFTNPVTPGCPPHVKEEREELVRTHIFRKSEGKYFLTREYTFTSPSKAASILLGQSASGNREWVDKYGKSLGSYK